MPDATGEAAPDHARGPLSGLCVIDCATLFAGPIVATLLCVFGAEIIKIEHPSGDPLRNMGSRKDGHGLWRKVAARNKRCIALDLKQSDDAEIFKRLVAEADLLVENFRTGSLEGWGLGWETLSALNPRLVMVRVTGFDQPGIIRNRTGNRSVNNAPRNASKTRDGRRVALSAAAGGPKEEPWVERPWLKKPWLEKPWDRYLGEADRAVLARGRFAQRMGFGARACEAACCAAA